MAWQGIMNHDDQSCDVGEVFGNDVTNRKRSGLGQGCCTYEKEPLNWLDIIWSTTLDFFFLLDILLNLRTAFYTFENTDTAGIASERKVLNLETRGSVIAKRYLTSWFVPDILGSLPLDIIMVRKHLKVNAFKVNAFHFHSFLMHVYMRNPRRKYLYEYWYLYIYVPIYSYQVFIEDQEDVDVDNAKSNSISGSYASLSKLVRILKLFRLFKLLRATRMKKYVPTPWAPTSHFYLTITWYNSDSSVNSVKVHNPHCPLVHSDESEHIFFSVVTYFTNLDNFLQNS